jgi:hypothetical protein
MVWNFGTTMIVITGMSVTGRHQWCVRAQRLIMTRFDDFAEVSKATTSRRSLLVLRIQCKWMSMINPSNDEV